MKLLSCWPKKAVLKYGKGKEEFDEKLYLNFFLRMATLET